MWRKRVGFLVALTLGVVALSVSGAASGGQAIRVSGTYVVSDIGIPACTPVGSSGFLFRCTDTGLVSDYSGDLTGSAVADLTEIVNCQTSRTNGTATETFTGSINGVGSGTLSWIDQFSADFDCTLFFPFNLDINSVAVKGSGDFVGLQGRLTFTDTTYSGVLH